MRVRFLTCSSASRQLSVRSINKPSALDFYCRRLTQWHKAHINGAVIFTEKLVDVWQEVGLELSNPAAVSCTFCDRPLHFDLMSEWEKSYFGNMEPQYITVSA